MSSFDPARKLRPIQLATLVILMAEAREVTNKELTAMANFTLTGRDRTELEQDGLIESRKIGQLLAFQLSDKGWAFCKQLHTTKVNVERSTAARSIFVLLDGLGRSLDRLRVSHAEFFKQAGSVDPEARIRAAYADLPKAADGWVGLADLREHLADLDPGTVDSTLRTMARREGVRIIPVANTKSLQPRDRAAALRIGEEDNHALWIGPA
jgi:hypothetical protein